MKELFLGSGIAHSIMVFAIVIAVGLYLGKIKIKGVSIGTTWILFMGIVASHFGLRANPGILSFVKDFGLILFVFAIGLQVGPGFFRSFKKGGVVMNLLALCLVLLAVAVTVTIHLVTGESLRTMVGVMSGAVTNTPGLGAAQNTLSDMILGGGGTHEQAHAASSALAGAYAVAYPLGVLGSIFSIIAFKSIGKIDLEKESKELDEQGDGANAAITVNFQVENPAIFGKSIVAAMAGIHEKCVVSGLAREGISIPFGKDVLLQKDDIISVVTTRSSIERMKMVFGREIENAEKDATQDVAGYETGILTITKHEITGTKLRDLDLRRRFGVNVIAVSRSGVDLVPGPNLILEVGDSLAVVGDRKEIEAAAELVGNNPENLAHPNLIPIFIGIALGVILGSLPIHFPMMPQPVKLGLAGGPLIVAILLGYFGPRLRITTYTTMSANKFLSEVGICLFMAAVGLGAGENFVSSIMGGGYMWILYGLFITVIPIVVVMLLARLVFHLNFYQICGLVAGGSTNPPALAFTQGAYGTSYPSVNYATVYPLTMFLRVIAAQVLVLFTM